MQKCMIGKLKTMKHKQDVSGPFSLSRRNQLDNSFLYRLFQKYLKRGMREYPSYLAPIKTDNKLSLWYREIESLVIHVEQVSKNLGEHGRLQILVETFTGQAA